MRAPATTLLLAVTLMAGLPACATVSGWLGGGTRARATLLEHERAWAEGLAPPESVEQAREAIARLARAGFGSDQGRQAVPDLARLAITSPSSLVRADALRAAWALVEVVPPEPYPEDTFDLEAFNARANALADVLEDPERAHSAEGLDLARWLGGQRLPPRYAFEGVSLASAMLSQSLYWEGPLAQVLAEEYPGLARHAAVLATARGAVDDASVVRLEALHWTPRLDPALAYPILSGTLARETDSLLLIAALDGLDALRGSLSRDQIEQAVRTLPLEPDPAVRRRLERLLASLS